MSRIRKQLAHAEMVWGFEEAHPSGRPECVKLMAELEEGIARARGLWAEQLRGIRQQHEAVVSWNGLRKTIQKVLLPYLVLVAKVASRKNPELGRLFRRPRHNCANRWFLRVVRAILSTAQAHEEELVAEGLGQDFMGDFGAKVGQLEAAAAGVEAGWLEHTRATAELRRILGRIATRAGKLENLHMVRHTNYEELLAAWGLERRASKVARPLERERRALRLIS